MRSEITSSEYQKYSKEEMESWMPLFLTGRLDVEKRRIFEEWLKADDQAGQRLESWREIQAALTGERLIDEPSQRIWVELKSKIDRDYQNYLSHKRFSFSPASLFSGFAFALLTLLVLWLSIRPGVLLNWSISGPTPVSYRIYRAPANSSEFVLVGEFLSKPGVQDYRYLDSLYLPGYGYTYRIEGIGEANVPIFSQAVHSTTTGALPGQLAILVASALVGLLAAELIQQRTRGKYLSHLLGA